MSKAKSQPAETPKDAASEPPAEAPREPKQPPRETYVPTPKSGLYVREGGVTRAVEDDEPAA